MEIKDQTVVIKNTDMSPEMQQISVEIASKVLHSYETGADEKYQEMAYEIKNELDNNLDTTWHCVVGMNFGTYVSHETYNFIHFYIGKFSFCFWKTL